MERFNPGDRVRAKGINSGAVYEGPVVGIQPAPMYGAELLMTIEKVVSGVGQAVGSTAYVTNVKRIEMPYVKNLVGPKPKPVQAPKFPTPWTTDGSNVLDANHRVVVRLRHGGFENGSFHIELPMNERYELARVIAEAVTAFYKAKAGDSESPF